MRLICPECNALYEVPDEMIPEEGREVECSACGHVWEERPGESAARDARPAAPPSSSSPSPQITGGAALSRGLSDDLRLAGLGRAHDVERPDLGEAPALQRPLPDDVLSILREETARELTARRAARQQGRSAEETPAEGSDPQHPTRPESPPAESAPAKPPISTTAADEERPGQRSQPGAAQPISDAPGEELDWPATTVTAPDDTEPRILPARDRRDEKRPPAPIPAASPHRPPEETGSDVASTAPHQRDRGQGRGVPDAKALAATLASASPSTSAKAENAAPSAAETSTRPDDTEAPQTDRYRAGLTRALLAAALLVVAYVVAVFWVHSGTAPAPVQSALAAIDTARAGLQSLFGRGAD
ncbi:zinc-ribbon domain-containing protein [Paracoccus sediminicola]|uniref:zinc-ribbon domain-containing protein n=1 Tax=Paracoccus sediminicola TaxID=3017783 RepID=UPI0022F01C55|nr:zinc-ribbon domain-containing protein [Paracoccus sediminicola]WBU56897.1 zinc-ribbon domain-containing protein [Paracoccus sediminicola]